VDPSVHTSRKAAVKTRAQKHEDQDVKQEATRPIKSQRFDQAPVIEDGKATMRGSTSRKVLKEQQFCRKKAADEPKSNPTISGILQRIKARKVEVDNQRTDEAMIVPRSEIERKRISSDQGLEEPRMKKARRQAKDESEDRRSATRAMHEAVSMQQAKRRRQEAAMKVDEDRSAIYEADPQLPGRQGGTQAILERLNSEARGRPSSAIATSNKAPSKNSKGEVIVKQKGKHLLRQETAGRISEGELHAINNLLKVRPAKSDHG